MSSHSPLVTVVTFCWNCCLLLLRNLVNARRRVISNFKVSIFYFVKVRVLVLVTEVLWLLKFLQGKPWDWESLRELPHNDLFSFQFICLYISRGYLCLTIKRLKKFCSIIWPVLCLKSDELTCWITPTLDSNCLISITIDILLTRDWKRRT